MSDFPYPISGLMGLIWFRRGFGGVCGRSGSLDPVKTRQNHNCQQQCDQGGLRSQERCSPRLGCL